MSKSTYAFNLRREKFTHMKHSNEINGELKIYFRQIILGVRVCIKLVQSYFSKLFEVRHLDLSD